MRPGESIIEKKRKILWLVNLLLPDASAALGFTVLDTGCWITGLVSTLRAKTEDLAITILAPTSLLKEEKRAVCNGVEYIAFPAAMAGRRAYFARLLNEIQPDVVHIFGTEFAHCLDMVEVAEQSRMVISLQGLLNVCKDLYFYGLPARYRVVNPVKALVQKAYTGDVISLGQRSFKRRAQAEATALQKARYVIGRTDWDRASALRLNPGLQYFFCNEILRESFYTGGWQRENCKKHTLFISQANYPIKGLHLFLPALALLVKRYPDLQVRIAGTAPVTSENALVQAGVRFFFEYQTYCEKMAKRLGVWKHLHFLGPLTEAQMKEEYLRAHVFVSCSVMENESNSVSEAKMLGLPVVASYVGGLGSRIVNGQDGFLYPLAEAEMAVYYIGRLFEEDALCCEISRKGRESAQKVNDRSVNGETMLNIYRTITK